MDSEFSKSRIVLSCQKQTREILETAARQVGQSLSDFMISASLPMARDILHALEEANLIQEAENSFGDACDSRFVPHLQGT